MKTAYISQSVLEKYQELHNLEKECRVKREALRDQLIELLRDGAPVEKGALDARLLECKRITFSREKLIALLGAQQVQSLRAKIEPTIQNRLLVEKRLSGKCKKQDGSLTQAIKNSFH